MSDVQTDAPAEPDYQVGGVEQLFLPGGVPVAVAEQAAVAKAEHDAEYYAAMVTADVPPEVPPVEDAAPPPAPSASPPAPSPPPPQDQQGSQS